jgi:hypothetical protein
MGGRGLLSTVLALAWLAAACSEKSSDTATSPEFAPPVQNGCSTSALIGYIKTEFGNSSDQAKLAGDLKNYGAKTVQATYVGYKLLDAIATKYDIAANQTASRTNASNAAIAILNCINIGSTPVPTSGFETQLGSAGAFEVRGRLFSSPTTPDKRPVASHDGVWVLEPPGTSSWPDITTLGTIGLDSAQDLFLAYGQPLSSSGFSNDDVVNNLVFDWATVPQGAVNGAFAKIQGVGAVIGVCGTDPLLTSYLQHNTATTGPEVLGFITPRCPPTFAFRESEPRTFAERVGRLFSPTPAFAAMVATTGTGGSKSKLSPFGLIDPDSVNLSALFAWNKQADTVGKPFKPTPKYQILSQAGTPFLQDYVLIWIEAIGNNGLNADVCNNWAFTNANGIAQFPAAFPTKAGGYTFSARTTGTSSKPGVNQGDAPTVPPGASLPSPIVNVKNGTLPACPAGSTYHGEPTLPTPPGLNGFAP